MCPLPPPPTPPTGSFVGSLLQVRRVESHWLWSYGLGDKVLNIWRQDSRISGSRDASELLAMAQAANRLYEVSAVLPSAASAAAPATCSPG